MSVFHRQALAQLLATRLLRPLATSASSSGLFLAAPRRTGKSTFVREDLRPALEDAGSIVIYADLWEDRSADPGDVIVNAIRAELAKRTGVVERLARSAGMDSVKLGGLSFSLDRVGLAKGVSLSAALTHLSDETKKVIVLVIDEAQHAITTQAGSDALFALKAARDEINSSRHFGLRVVATGSNRDKLAMLRNSKDQAFFQAPMTEFPPLDINYIRWFLQQLPFGAELDDQAVFELFQQAAYRPEVLAAAVDELNFDLTVQPGQYAERLATLVTQQIAASNSELMRVVHGLTPLQSAVLRVLAAAGANFAPFEHQTMQRYARVLQVLDPASPVTPDASNVQQVLVALQERGLVWRASRGVYALEEAFLVDVLAQDVDATAAAGV